MKIVSLNKNPERYGYLSEMDYKNPNFHGHQTALAIGIKRPDGSWQEVYTSGDTLDEKIKIADEILNDKSLIILEDKITQLENDKLVSKTIYYFPYLYTLLFFRWEDCHTRQSSLDFSNC